MTTVMKRTKITIGMILIAAACVSYGQLVIHEGSFRLADLRTRLYNDQNHRFACFTAEQRTERNRIERWMYDLSSWCNDSPVEVKRTGILTVTVAHSRSRDLEPRISLEDWMSKPFESAPVEEELSVESWMEAPFDLCTEADSNVSLPFTMIHF